MHTSGEPCSWWQTAEVKHFAKQGGTKGAFHKSSKGNIDKPGSEAVNTGRPTFNDTRKEYLGPLSKQCRCTHGHKSVRRARVTSKFKHVAVCAEFLHLFSRLPEGKESLNMVKESGSGEHLFSPLADADSLANFFLKLQRWLQAVFPMLEERLWGPRAS